MFAVQSFFFFSRMVSLHLFFPSLPSNKPNFSPPFCSSRGTRGERKTKPRREQQADKTQIERGKAFSPKIEHP